MSSAFFNIFKKLKDAVIQTLDLTICVWITWLLLTRKRRLKTTSRQEV